MKPLKKIAVMLLGGAFVAGTLYAQPSSVAPPKAAAPPAAKVNLSPEQMKKEAQTLRDRVRADIQRLHYLQAKARKANDVIKLTCVNDKFIKLKADANLFDDAHRELLGVLDSDGRFDAYTRVISTAAEVQRAREEADVCVGETELGRESMNDFEGPDVIDDPTLGLPFDIEVEPPAYASPYI